MADLKAVYAAVDEQAASDVLDAFAQKWDKKHPKFSQSWRNNRANLSTCFILFECVFMESHLFKKGQCVYLF